MFTGIVEELGTIAHREGSRLRIRAGTVLDDVAIGDSIAVNGCCLTVSELDPDDDTDGDTGSPTWWEADVTAETSARTNLGSLAVGDRVNLERPVRLADRLGGHLVQGHVDAVAEILEEAPTLRVSLPVGLDRYVVEKGSITVDGISLTVVDVDVSDAVTSPAADRATAGKPQAPAGSFTVAVIPHTAAVTTLGFKRRGDTVNLEVDVMAKYAERLLAGHLTTDGPAIAPSPPPGAVVTTRERT
jgi:riboflavin synthase